MKNVRVTGYGTLNVEIFHSVQFTGIATDDKEINNDELEQKAKNELEERYRKEIEPILKQLTEVVGNWEIKDHDEEIIIEDEEEA